jgi:hypothetical protein
VNATGVETHQRQRAATTNGRGRERVAPAEMVSVVGVPLFDRRASWLRLAFWVLGLALALLHAWESRHLLNVDGVSYLDVADAYLRGDAAAVNGHWSPLYSWILAGALLIVQPSPFWESTLVHFVNVAVFVATMAAFDLLLREVVRAQRAERDADGIAALPAWAWVAVGYSLFLWSSLHLITVWLVTPDLLVAAFVYLAAAMVLRIWRQPSLRRFVGLGGALGAGYLAKAPMLPLAVVFLLAAAAALHRDRRRAVRYGAAAVAALLLISGPFIAALSASKGRFTFGESRVVSYAWLVNQVPDRNWQGGAQAGGQLLHPTRKIHDRPAAYEFATPLPGTYPVWYDPSYWHEGIKPAFRLSDNVRAVVGNAREYYGIVFGSVQSSLVFALAICLYAAAPWRQRVTTPLVLLAPAVAGLGMYAVVSVMPRYVGPFVALFWVALFAWVRLPASRLAERVISGATVTVAAMLMFATLLSASPRGIRAAQELTSGDWAVGEPNTVAAAVLGAGVHPGDRVAIIYPPPETASVARLVNWARAARLSIVAEVPPEESRAFWGSSQASLAPLIARLRALDVRALVTMNIPDDVPALQLDGWRRIPGTRHAVYPLQ